MILTDSEIAEICCDVAQSTPCDIAYARAIEAAILKKIGEPVGHFLFNDYGGWQQLRDDWRELEVEGELSTTPAPLYKLPEVTK